MTGKDRNRSAHELVERLNKLSRSTIVAASREFRLAGLTAQAGCCYFHAGQRDFRSIELVASSSTKRNGYWFTISWHVAVAPGEANSLLVVTGTGEQNNASQSLSGFRPLSNAQGRKLLPLMRQPYTGITLLDAPRILGRCLEDALLPEGLESPNHQALQRTLNSAYQATLQATADADNSPLQHFKIAVPLLISPADLYAVKLGDNGVESDDSSFMGLQITDNTERINQPIVDIINPEFIATYAKMAAETAAKLPDLIDQFLSNEPASTVTTADNPNPGPRFGKQSQIDAWEAFRNL